jgi:transposase
MGRPKLKLVVDAKMAGELRKRFLASKEPKEKERLQAVLLAMSGSHTHGEIAGIVGRARSLIQIWLDRFETGGIEGLLKRGKAPGKTSALQRPAVQKQMVAGLREGRWLTAPQLAAWLRKKHGIVRKPQRLYYWLGKLGGKRKVPRPSHVKKNAADAKEFAAHFHDRLCALSLPAGRPVRIWVVDEMRYGLHSFTRRCWGLRGVRVIKPSQQKYQWGYAYGALEVVEGAAAFRYMPSVNLPFLHVFLEQIAANDPAAEHVVIWDQAGFHQRPGDPSLPEHVHILPLPPYSPELNPVEKLWDVAKDALANHAFPVLGKLEAALTGALRPFWTDPARTLALVGTGWLHSEANAS